MTLPPQEIRSFRLVVWNYYRRNRRSFPWRRTRVPYRILVSEIMLQQTQAKRVVSFYDAFIRRFPSVVSLAHASTADVLRVWQGLGYNRRALHLKRAAEMIVDDLRGRFPKTESCLGALPGVGTYTAAAIAAFSYDRPAVVIETNIRTVYLHHFFPRRRKVSDREIADLVEQTLDRKAPRLWYQALMDYGSMLKSMVGNVNTKSVTYVKQAPFKGSRREIRGRLLRLALKSPLTNRRLRRFSEIYGLSFPLVRRVAVDLVNDGFLRGYKKRFVIN